MPSISNLEIYQGDDYGAVVTVTDDYSAVDLTGYTPRAQIRFGPADENPDVIVQFQAALVLPNMINLTIPHDVTGDMDWGRYIWDLQLTDPAGIVQTIIMGDVKVTSQVTREY